MSLPERALGGLFSSYGGLLVMALALSMGACMAPTAEASGKVSLPAHMRPALAALLDGFAPDEAHRFQLDRMDDDNVRFRLVKLAPDGGELVLGHLGLHHRSAAEVGGHASKSFMMRPDAEPGARVEQLMALAMEEVKLKDRGGYFIPAIRSPSESQASERQVRGEAISWWLPLLLSLLLLGAIATQVRRARWDDVLSVHYKRTHLLPAILQSTLFLYWGLHWRELASHVPFIAAQLVYVYLLESALSLLFLKRWRLSFGPVPIVLSTNLFVQYSEWIEHYMVGIALTAAVVSKIFIRRDGRHIFNPSALGLAVIGALWLTLDGSSEPGVWRLIDLPDGDIAHYLNLPPNMAELIVIVATVAHLRVPVVLITMSSFLAMALIGPAYDPYWLGPDWAPILLVLALLITDPATSPKTPGGQIFFGLSAGLIISTVSMGLEMNGVSDFYSKVLLIPLINGLVPTFDRLGPLIEERVSWVAHRFNRRHVLVWLVLFGLYVSGGGKGRFFESEAHFHIENESRFVHIDEMGHLSCEVNPLHCKPFNIEAELRCWSALGGSDDTPCGNLVR